MTNRDRSPRYSPSGRRKQLKYDVLTSVTISNKYKYYIIILEYWLYSIIIYYDKSRRK